jgi:hypothetical protein
MTRNIGSWIMVLAALAGSGTAMNAQGMKQEMMMQPGASQMKIVLRSPAAGSKITGNSITLRVTTSGFRKNCDFAGKPNRAGEGHYHVLLDKALVDMFCSSTATVSLKGLKPGSHVLTVVPAQNDHTEVEQNASSATFTYQPSRVEAPTTAAAFSGVPSIKIISPKSGAVVSGSFDVVVDVRNFSLTCDEMGRQPVAGHGHWHLNLDTMTGPMMGMATMAGMSCRRVLRTSAAGLKPGSTHTLIALLADNLHAPLMPTVADKVRCR